MNSNVIFLSVLFFLNPFSSGVISFYMFYKDPKNKFYMALSLSLLILISYSLIIGPQFDVFRHYTSFDIINNLDGNFIEYLKEKPDLILSIYYKIITLFSDNKQYIHIMPAIAVYSFPFLIVKKLRYDINKKGSLYTIYFLLFFSFFFSLDKWTGMRNVVANVLMYLGVYNFYIKGKKKSLFLIILAALTHASHIISLLIVILIAVLKKWKLKKKTINMFLIASLVIFLIPESFFIEIIKVILPYLPRGIAFKISTNFVRQVSSESTLWLRDLIYKTFHLTNILILFYLTKKCELKKKYISYLKFLFIYIVFTFTILNISKVGGPRYLENSGILSLIINICILEESKIKKNKYKIIYICYIVLFLINNLIFSLPLLNPKVIAYTLPQTLLIKVDESEYGRSGEFYNFLRKLATGRGKVK